MAFLYSRSSEHIFHRILFDCSIGRKTSCTFEIRNFLHLIESDFDSDNCSSISSTLLICTRLFLHSQDSILKPHQQLQEADTCSTDYATIRVSSIEFLIAAPIPSIGPLPWPDSVRIQEKSTLFSSLIFFVRKAHSLVWCKPVGLFVIMNSGSSSSRYTSIL